MGATALFVLVFLGVFMSMLHGMKQREESFLMYRAVSALRDKVAEIQYLANLPTDLQDGEGIRSIYSRFHDTTSPVADLPGGEIQITCYADENTVPNELGGPQDLNYDSDALDDATQSAGTDLNTVPMALSLTFVEQSVAHTVTVHRLITRTTD